MKKSVCLILCIALAMLMCSSSIFAASADKQDVTEFLNESMPIEDSGLSTKHAISVNDTSEEIQSALLAETFSLDGTVLLKGKKENINEFYDFASYSRYEIAEWAHAKELISEEEKIEVFCDLINARNFKNIKCLEWVFDEIVSYQRKNDAPIEIISKIKKAIPHSLSQNSLGTEEDMSFMDDSENESRAQTTYSSSHFTITYDNSEHQQAFVANVASYLEEVRTAYLNMGFREPELEWFQSGYRVFLEPSPETFHAGATTKNFSITNTCSSYMTLYVTADFNQNLKEIIAHEYFHAIQNVYNHQSGWFKEACADWGMVVVVGSSGSSNEDINTFINTHESMFENDGYGVAVFPLAIHKKYGGHRAILEIYQEYNERSATIGLDELRNVISDALTDLGYSGGFNSAFRWMSSYLYNPSLWYSSVYSGASAWRNTRINTHTLQQEAFAYTYYGTIAPLASVYYQFSPPSGATGTIMIRVAFETTDGVMQTYTRSNTGIHNVVFCETNSSGVALNYAYDSGNTVTYFGGVLTNLSSTEEITYSMIAMLYNE